LVQQPQIAEILTRIMPLEYWSKGQFDVNKEECSGADSFQASVTTGLLLRLF